MTSNDVPSLYKTVQLCEAKFLEYSLLHRAKGTPEAELKAKANEDMANTCRLSLELADRKRSKRGKPVMRNLDDNKHLCDN